MDYIYHNKSDSIRVRIFKRKERFWDADIFYRDGVYETVSVELADVPGITKREVKEAVEDYLGMSLFLYNKVDSVTEGWN